MLNSSLIGSYISSLRKAKDLTQVELAEQVNVSHQAVSKWERGESLPDIGTLIVLGEVFGVSIDHILSGGRSGSQPRNVGKLVEKLSDNLPEQAAELLNSGESEVEGFISLAPLLKSSMIENVANKVSNQTFTLEHLIELAPFMERESLDELVNKMDTTNLLWAQISSLAPFITHSTLSDLVSTNEYTLNVEELIEIVPFLGSEIDRLVLQADLTDSEWDHVIGLTPFLKKETLIHLVNHSNTGEMSIDKLVSVAPFLGHYLNQLVEEMDIKDVRWGELPRLAPFIRKETLARLIEKIVDDEGALETLLDIVPFVGRDQLDHLLQKVNLSGLTPDIIADIAPFVKKETLTKLMSNLVK
ncbi:helix-turn-helix domain-containing protein [Cytobacillus suaedae]|nr:helix-turn-helix domain-containing protein [Cytobacillus suaedae]